MNCSLTKFIFLIFLIGGPSAVSGQAVEICGETGSSPFMNAAAVFGKVRLEGFDRNAKLPKITITLTERSGRDNRVVLGRSGNYCFRNISGGGGTLIIDIEGVEVARETLPTGGINQHRQDFNVYPISPATTAKPGWITAKYAYDRSATNSKLLETAVKAESAKESGKALKLLAEIVTADPKDFVVWARIGSIHFDQQKYSDSVAAYLKSIEAKPDFGFAHMVLGRTYLIQSRITEAIASLTKATTLEPETARGYQLLGEAYIVDRKSALGIETLYEAIRLDPTGMAESHLLIARLYDLAGAKPHAAREYKLFLEKVPNHQDKKKFERYIKDHPPAGLE